MNRLICLVVGHRWRYVHEFFIPRSPKERQGSQCDRCLKIVWAS